MGATELEPPPPREAAEYFSCAIFWGAPTTVDAPALACDADWAIVAMWSPVNCTSRNAIQGEKPATSKIRSPVIAPVIEVSGDDPLAVPMPPNTPSPITKMMIRISLEKTSANMASSHLRTQPRERSATPPAKAIGAKIAVMRMSIFRVTNANQTIGDGDDGEQRQDQNGGRTGEGGREDGVANDLRAEGRDGSSG